MTHQRQRRPAPFLAFLVLLAALSPVLAQEAAVPRLEFLEPARNSVLTGEVEVRLRATPAELIPEQVYLSPFGPPWLPLERDPETGEWTLRLDTTLFPNGEQTLVARAFYGPGGARRSADLWLRVRLANELRHWFGQLHGHTSYSDGWGFPAEAYAFAREPARLDFFALTDHLEGLTTRVWADSLRQAWEAHEDGAFVVLTGLEWTKAIGHLNIFEPGTHRWPADLPGFYQAAADAGALAKFNHPCSPPDPFDSFAYSEVGDRVVQLIEVRSEAEEREYLRALDAGWHLAPCGSDDDHVGRWGRHGTWTVALMPGLSRLNLWDALQNRRVYSTRDRNCLLRFSVNGAEMGEVLAEPVREVSIVVEVSDPDPEDTLARIELFENGVIVQTDEPQGAERRWTTTAHPGPGRHYYLVKVTQTDGDRLWSAPIWVTVAE